MSDAPRLFALVALLAASPALGQDAAKPKGVQEHGANGEVARYCASLAPSASEARAAYQLRRLADLEAEVREAMQKLEAKEAEARDWVTKREAMMKAATDDVVAVYNKMAPDAAATQLAEMEEPMAAAVLTKLKPQTASAVLAEMSAGKAAKLSALMAGQQAQDRS